MFSKLSINMDIRIFILFLLLFLVNKDGFSQENVSIEELMIQHKENPNNLDVLSQLAQNYELTHSDSAFYFANILLEKSNNNADYQCRAYQVIANTYLQNNKLDSAVFFYVQAVDLSKQAHLDYDHAFYLQSLAQAYLNKGLFKDAIINYSKSISYLESAKARKDTDRFLTMAYGGLGDSYTQISAYNMAIESILKSLKYAQKMADPLFIGIAYNSLASVYSSIEDYTKSIKYNNLALLEFQKTDYLLAEATVYFNLANDFFKLNKMDSSLILASQSKLLLESIPTEYNLGSVYTLLGQIEYANNNIKQSNEFFRQAKEIHLNSGSENLLGVVYVELSKNLLKENNLLEALSLANKAKNIFEKHSMLKEKLAVLSFLIENSNSLSSSKDYFKDYQLTNKEYLNKEKQNAIIASEIQFETEHKEAQLAEKELIIAKEKNIKIIGFSLGSFLLLSGIGFFFFYKKQQSHLQLKSANELLQLQQEINKMELMNLNARLDPHEIKNLLASLSPEIQEKAPHAYKKMLKLLNLIKASLGNESFIEGVDLQLKQAEDYLKLIQSNYFIPVSYHIKNKLSSNQVARFPRLIIKNLTENAVKHGFRNINREGIVEIKIQEDSDFFYLYVVDNGVGYHPETASNGLGILTYKNLFHILNKTNKQNAIMNITYTHPGTKIEVMVPKNYRWSIQASS